MRYLLDSNIVYWLRFNSPIIDARLRQLLEDPNETFYYSVITPWELSIKHAKGKLPLPENFFPSLSQLGFDCLPIEEEHIDALRTLPVLHGDPFDRMLAAQAYHEHLTLITGDKRLAAYPIKTLLVEL